MTVRVNSMILAWKITKLINVSLVRCHPLRLNFLASKPLFYSSSAVKNEPEIPENPLSKLYSASGQPENGAIYDKKPFRMRCEKNKKYSWCLCGHSKTQPLCDGTHKSPYLKIKLRPVRFQVTEEKEYWLCNCKQTSNRPFCDGTHKREDIQQTLPK